MTFFALIILQGVIEKPDVKSYWSTREVLRTPAFGDVMSRDRFMLIMKFLHLTDNEAPVDGHPNPKLRKLWPVLTRMTEMFQTLYTPERDVSVDESLLRFKGRLSWKQYMPLKRARFGVKFFVLCESSSGYIWNMLMYTGKGAVVGDADMAMGTRVVLSLMSPLLDKGYCVTVDNYYNSPELVEALLERKTDVYGTARSGRKGMPSFDTRQLEKGQTEAYQKSKCLSLQWKDKKVVTFLSTVHSVAMVDVTNQRGEVASKPQIVMN
ncbi:piggyBac transposable element-derived protein 4-like [Ixodes scapularis]|uniref:piggyBac transposable element-derived protein 4-like n=1 Tax=Ixodes scapularis TaxID=6945 RepID=UPI001A9E7827|nr:piggyBac transposable element-derived protein 4-like [Ixodes scapularis]